MCSKIANNSKDGRELREIQLGLANATIHRHQLSCPQMAYRLVGHVTAGIDYKSITMSVLAVMTTEWTTLLIPCALDIREHKGVRSASRTPSFLHVKRRLLELMLLISQTLILPLMVEAIAAHDRRPPRRSVRRLAPLRRRARLLPRGYLEVLNCRGQGSLTDSRLAVSRNIYNICLHR